MSAKWRQVQAWDDEHLTGPLKPVKWVLRAFSSITLAVMLLVLVALYGVSASVPVGLIALAPTYLIYGLTLLVSIGVVAGVPVWLVRKAMARSTRPLRFAVVFVLGVGLAAVAVWGWWHFAWPRLHYDPATHAGLRLFGGFVDRNSAVTLRRLPGMEMSELEYYSWWPLRVILMMFVLNMVVSTVRRIEFTFKNIGVLTVHTGIVTIALGSVYYSGLKREGDTVLLAGRVNPETGSPGIGPAQGRFFDNTRVALYVGSGKGVWDYAPLVGVPRYNNYNLGVEIGESAWEASGRPAPWKGSDEGPLSIGVRPLLGGVIDPDISLRVVGYCFFAEPVKDWVKARPTDEGVTPLRIVYMHSSLPDDTGKVDSDKPVFAFTLPPAMPQERIAESRGAMSLEYTLGPRAGMPEERWRDLTEKLPSGTMHALVVEVPGAKFRSVYPVVAGTQIDVGGTGYKLFVKELRAEPPFPIITEGYKGAASSMAVVTVTQPGMLGAEGESYERWVYHRFPQINQDMLKELNARGMPKRRDADPAIRVALVESDQLNVYVDESVPGRARAVVRRQGGDLTLIDPVAEDGWIDLGIEKVRLRIGERWDAARQVERAAPASAEAIGQEKAAVGAHDKAMLAVEVGAGGGAGGRASTIVWLPFTRYFGMGHDSERSVTLPDGRTVELAFGRLQHPLPGFEVRLADFQMISYDHRGSPRDYQSVLKVTPTTAGFEPFERVTRLNAPLTAPFYWNDERPWVVNFFGRLRSGMSPYQFKFSQSGWDAAGWQRTQQQADAGVIKKPFASFTILGVGNNPGIHLIALGGILMGLGIPWAFYVKPWLVRREKARVQQQLKSGTYVPPRRKAAAGRQEVGAGA